MTTTSHPNSPENLSLLETQPKQTHSFELELSMGEASHRTLDIGIPGLSFIEASVENSKEKNQGVVQAQSEVPLQTSEKLDGNEALGSGVETLLVGAETDSLSLPAALCDDLLLEEINSIPDKMGFKIGDVADLLGIKQYVLRYWESEFDILRPKKASNNQRMYSRKDVENAFLIRKLLHRDRFSIEGARNALKELKAHVRKEKDYTQVFVRLESFHERIEDLAREMRGLRRLFKT